MASADDEAALLLRLVKDLPDDEQLVLMSWLLKPPAERVKSLYAAPGWRLSAPVSFGVVDPQLTQREALVLLRLAEGSDPADVAHELSVAEATVRNHLRNVAEKLALTARTAPTRSELTMLPVRLPKQTHEELKQWASEHGFPMSVIVRGLIERFLEQQRAS